MNAHLFAEQYCKMMRWLLFCEKVPVVGEEVQDFGAKYTGMKKIRAVIQKHLHLLLFIVEV